MKGCYRVGVVRNVLVRVSSCVELQGTSLIIGACKMWLGRTDKWG